MELVCGITCGCLEIDMDCYLKLNLFFLEKNFVLLNHSQTDHKF